MAFYRALLLVFPLAISCSAGQSTAQPRIGLAAELTDGPRLSAPRATHAMVRAANGNILAIGGCVEEGCEAGRASATVDIFSPDGREHLGIGTLLAQRVGPEAVPLADGRILVVGGWIGRSVTATTEIFDPRTGKSIAGPDMAGPRNAPVVVVLADGQVLIAGGYDGTGLRNDAEIFDPATSRMTQTARQSEGRSGATGTLLPDGKVLIVGGGNAVAPDRHTLASAELFDPATRSFAPTGALVQKRYKHGAIALPSGDVLIVGGSDERDYGGKLRSVERYEVGSGRFVRVGDLAAARFKLAGSLMILNGDRVLVAAGDERPEIFDLRKGSGRFLNVTLGARWNYLTVLPIDGRAAFLAGGYSEGRIEPTDQSWILRT